MLRLISRPRLFCASMLRAMLSMLEYRKSAMALSALPSLNLLMNFSVAFSCGPLTIPASSMPSSPWNSPMLLPPNQNCCRFPNWLTNQSEIVGSVPVFGLFYLVCGDKKMVGAGYRWCLAA